MSELNKAYMKSKDYSENLIDSIKSSLDDNSINYNESSYGNELLIENIPAKKIEKILVEKLNIPNDVFNILIDIVEAGKTVYVRQKTK